MQVIAAALLAGACDVPGPAACLTVAPPAVTVTVSDSVTRLPAAEGAVGEVRDGEYRDSLRVSLRDGDGTPLALSAATERAGTYHVEVRKAGYFTWVADGVRVRRGSCSIEPAQLRAELQPLP